VREYFDSFASSKGLSAADPATWYRVRRADFPVVRDKKIKRREGEGEEEKGEREREQ
jgi:hypothetical protein